MECMSPESMLALSRLDMAVMVALRRLETLAPEEFPSRRFKVGAIGTTPGVTETTTVGGPAGVGDCKGAECGEGHDSEGRDKKVKGESVRNQLHSIYNQKRIHLC